MSAAADLMNTDTRRISVVIPAYNAAAFIGATLKSVIEQTGRPGEIIVVDDGSSDDTANLARSFDGVQVISISNGGPSAARNAGTRAASGEFIAFLDADDMWAPDKLTRQLAALQSYGRPAFSFTDCRVFDEMGFHSRKGELRHHWEFRKSVKGSANRRYVLGERDDEPVMYGVNYILPSSVMVRRTDVLAVGAFDETLRYCEDYEFFLRLFRVMPAVVLVEPLLYYRQHSEQATKKSAISTKAAHFDVAHRVAASPERYPRGEVEFLARVDYLRHLRIAVLHARLEQIEDAVHHLECSLASRPTIAASLLLVALRVCRSGPGQRLLRLAKALWRSRPGRR